MNKDDRKIKATVTMSNVFFRFIMPKVFVIRYTSRLNQAWVDSSM
jgi:hypothetical protein